MTKGGSCSTAANQAVDSLRELLKISPFPETQVLYACEEIMDMATTDVRERAKLGQAGACNMAITAGLAGNEDNMT